MTTAPYQRRAPRAEQPPLYCARCNGRLLRSTRKVDGVAVDIIECVWCGMTPVSIETTDYGTLEAWTRVAPATVLGETFWATRAANVFARAVSVAASENESEGTT